MTGGFEPERLEGLSVSAGYFEVLGVPPILGTGFDGREDIPNGALQIVVSDGYWRNRMGQDGAVVGTALRLDDRSYTVVGVMPQSFRTLGGSDPEVWTLLQYDPAVADFDTREWGHHLDMIGRLRAEVTLDRATASLLQTAANPRGDFARPTWANLENGFVVQGLKSAATAEARPVTLILLGAVLLLLVVTCTNLIILQLARAFRRRGEFAMRLALGADRGRLVRFLATESVLLAGLGGLVGVGVARVGLSGLATLAPPALMASSTGSLDVRALAFALGLTSLVSLVFGLVPARIGSGERLVGASHGVDAGGVGHWRARRALVVAEVAMAVVLLVGAGLLLRTTHQLFSSSPGFDPSETIVLQVHGSGLESSDAVIHGFFDQAIEAVRAVPGVESAAFTSQLPLSGDRDAYGVTLEGLAPDAPENGPAFRYAVSPGYLEAMTIRGRGLLPEDEPGRAAVLSQSLARQLFGDGEALGQRVHLGPVDLPPFTVVGVAADVKQISLDSNELNGMYVPSHGWHWADRVRWVVVRTRLPVDAIAPSLRSAIWSANGSQPIVGTQSLSRIVARSEGQRRFVQGVLVAFALSALLLAGIGLYGVLSGAVSARTKELGVRMALGASRESILGLVVRQGLTLASIGTVVGLVAAIAGTRVLETLIFGVSRLDSVTYMAVVVAMGLVAGLACWVPARRAGRTEALDALRAE